jgi:hypothetical protein
MTNEETATPETPTTVVEPPPQTTETPGQQPGPPPVPPEPIAPTVKAEPTPEQVKEATDYVMSKGYSLAGATKIVSDYGAERILADKAADSESGAPTGAGIESGKEVFSGELVPGRTAVRVFNVDGGKPLKIEGMRDAGTEIDIYVRL